MADYVLLAELAAQATGKMFVIGVRPEGKGWFANCDGIEWDGDSPAMAVQSVIQTLAENTKRLAISASAQAKKYDQIAIGLDELIGSFSTS